MNKIRLTIRLMLLAGILNSGLASAQKAPVAAPEEWPSVAGLWVMELVSLSDTPVPIVEKVTARTFALALVDVTQKGPDLIFKEQVCRLDTQIEISVVQMTPSKNFIKALSGRVRTASLHRTANGEVELDVHQRSIVHSAKLKDEHQDKLPTEPNDPRVLDGDEDGHPGLTMNFSGLVLGQAYILQRTQSRMHGKQVAKDVFRGPMIWRTEQIILDVSNPFLRFAPKPKPSEGRGDSFFVMRKVSPDSSCDSISYSRQIQAMVAPPKKKDP